MWDFGSAADQFERNLAFVLIVFVEHEADVGTLVVWSKTVDAGRIVFAFVAAFIALDVIEVVIVVARIVCRRIFMERIEGCSELSGKGGVHFFDDADRRLLTI
ncbi:hypothetical protein X753_21755 [Mesorhizobium sp. LNJC399B00]|nr:hypothetical protein X753_21755 [Mesorhizobium sp. LNJC399B00]